MENKEGMSDFLSDARILLSEMKTTMEVIKEQNRSYREGIEKDISFQMERIREVERRWAVLRGIMISILILIVGTIVSGGIVLDNRPTAEEIKDEYVSKEQVFRGFGRVIENGYGVLEEKDIITTEEEKSGVRETQNAVTKEIDPGYVTRSVK